MPLRNRGGLVLALFFCSGATALVYEVVWSKFLSQMFGSTIYAQTVVLAAFMGGLALGNKLFGKRADGLREPVRVYGYMEIAIGLYAFFFPNLEKLVDRIFVALGTGIAEHSGWLLALKGALAVALLLGPTILMGGTLPLLAAWLQKSSTEAGRRSARFYSVNSLGAVAGSAAAGFWLVQNLGMVSSLQMTALLNVIVGATAILLSRSGQLDEFLPTQTGAPAETDAASPDTLRWAGAMVAATGFVSMGLEVLASRSLALIFGSSLQSFAIVLIAFILGIGLGSAWIASPRRRGRESGALMVVLLCAASLWVTVLVFNIERWVDIYRFMVTGLARTLVGYTYHQFLAAGISLVILGVPAACIGAVLPLMIRAVSQAGAALGNQVGALLTWNTLGAVVGTLTTGFVLMPLAGLRNAFGVLALALGAVALATAWRQRHRLGLAGAAVSCAAAIGLFAFGNEGWRHVMSSGVFRARESVFDPNAMAKRKRATKIIFYEDAPDATVSVDEVVPGTADAGEVGLRINGKPDASNHSDLSTQLLLAHLPMLVIPDAKHVFVLGLGSGISAGGLLSYPIEKIVVAENCAPVVRAAKLFEKWNRGILSDPRVRIWHEDARTVLKLHPQFYDVIITEPSNPWTVGVGSVFSQEYYELAKSRLKPGGIMAQWFHVYEMHDGIAAMVLRTFGSVFPHMEVWDTLGGDIVLLGSLQAWPSDPEGYRRGFAIDGVRKDLESIGIHSPEALLARQIASQRTAFAIAGKGPIQSDLFPVLEYAAPRAFFIGARAHLLEQYDERTRQLALAPARKRAVLSKLTPEEVDGLFHTFGTVNPELMAAIRAPADSQLPCLLKRLTAKPPATAATATNTNATAQLDAALEAGDLEKARQLALTALDGDPANARAGYVARVLERELAPRPAAGDGAPRP